MSQRKSKRGARVDPEGWRCWAGWYVVLVGGRLVGIFHDAPTARRVAKCCRCGEPPEIRQLPPLADGEVAKGT